MLFTIDTTFDLKPAEAHASCFPLYSPLLIDLRRFMLVMKWSRLIDKLWLVTNSLTNLPLCLFYKARSPQVMNGWGQETVLVFSCWNLWGFLTFCFQGKFYLDLKLILCNILLIKICDILCLNTVCIIVIYYMMYLRPDLKCIVAVCWNSDKNSFKKPQVFVKPLAPGNLNEKITFLLSTDKQSLSMWERNMTEVVHCKSVLLNLSTSMHPFRTGAEA